MAAPPPYSWSQSLEPLEPDRCEDDPCAVCAYFHKKRRALAGHTVSDQDARWVGVGVGVNPDPSSGWRYPVLGVADRPELPPSEITLLQRLMRVDVTPNASEFLR